MSYKKRNHIHVPDDPPRGPSLFLGIILLFIAPPVSTLAGIYMLLKRGRLEFTRRQLRDFRHYAAIIGDRSSVSIRELATRLGKSTDEVINDIQAMIDRDIIDARAYIDRRSLLLYMQDETIETDFVNPTVNVYVNTNQTQSAPIETHFVEKAEKPKAEAPKPAPESDKPKARHAAQQPRKLEWDSEDFEAKLREIRQLNDDIDNDAVSERIDRIGALTASIFRVVREKPERAEEVRKFMNYYLPTTLKLLKSYSLMEKQSYQGENIQASRKKIEDVLETLVHAFEQQQDKLFQSDALDVETDISVLETMMASDGLTEKGQGLHL
ncbi:MAG: 5-bromo-4-chloroindolyl phosphate hydrolysis family protein [Clostridia bacterium]|nr:5-bromo-4-chloroindolyl phosphate hydrolysis family protein [Clostridia bacterium]